MVWTSPTETSCHGLPTDEYIDPSMAQLYVVAAPQFCRRSRAVSRSPSHSQKRRPTAPELPMSAARAIDSIQKPAGIS